MRTSAKMQMKQGVGEQGLAGAEHASPALIAGPTLFAAPIPALEDRG